MPNPDLVLRMFDFCIANGMNAVLPHLYKAIVFVKRSVVRSFIGI